MRQNEYLWSKGLNKSDAPVLLHVKSLDANLYNTWRIGFEDNTPGQDLNW